MNLLAFDTSTDRLSIGLSCSGEQIVESGPGGAAASSTLIPSLMALLGRAGITLRSLDAIVFGAGPGSFTGLRTACSVAQGLAFGADRPVLPVETLMAVAEDARSRGAGDAVLAVLDARMDEVYCASYTFSSTCWHRAGDIFLCAPEALRLSPGWTLAGNAFPAYGDRLPAGARQEALPTAAALLRLAPALLAQGQARPADFALPVYVRDKVAQTIEERAAARALADAGAHR